MDIARFAWQPSVNESRVLFPKDLVYHAELKGLGTMAEDLVDRLIRLQHESQSETELAQRLALERAEIVRENSDPLWRAIISEIRFLVDKYNKQLHRTLFLNPQEPETGSELEVRSDVFPLVTMSLSRPSAHFFEFSIDRTESSFAARKVRKGRITVKPDLERNVFMVAQDGERLPTPKHLAEYLLKPVFEAALR